MHPPPILCAVSLPRPPPSSLGFGVMDATGFWANVLRTMFRSRDRWKGCPWGVYVIHAINLGLWGPHAINLGACIFTHIRTYFVCTYMHTYIRTYTHKYIRTYAHAHMQTSARMNVRAYVYACVRTYVHLRTRPRPPMCMWRLDRGGTMRPMFHSLAASGHTCPRAADHDCDDDDDGADGDDGDDYERTYVR